MTRSGIGKILLMVVLIAITAVPAYADDGGNGGVKVLVDGSRFWQDGSEDPLARLHDAFVYPCSGEEPSYYYAWPHPDESWTDMGFRIANVEYSWHYDLGGGADYFGVANGSCRDLKVVIPNMYLLTRGDPGEWPPCFLISETYPSVDRQSALCFSDEEFWGPLGFYDPDWVADSEDNCAEPVYFDGIKNYGEWGCDGLMQQYHGVRLPLYSEDGNNLWEVYLTHLSHIQ
jgi:hypothetical protein